MPKILCLMPFSSLIVFGEQLGQTHVLCSSGGLLLVVVVQIFFNVHHTYHQPSRTQLSKIVLFLLLNVLLLLYDACFKEPHIYLRQSALVRS